MSEYQYYEFRAIDRPFTKQEMASLRATSTRAHITSTSFINIYNYGDFRGDPEAIMETCCDAFVYVSNWGTHTFMLRLPKRALGSRDCRPFRADDNLQFSCKGEHTILSFRADEIELYEEEEGEGWMSSLLPIRADLLQGDFRALYLGWLAGVQRENVDDDQMEPPVPSGLRDLPAALHELARFLDIDSSLLEAAAELSVDRELAGPPDEVLADWIASLSEKEKNNLLVQVASGKDLHVGANLMRRFQRECVKTAVSVPTACRTAGELRAEADRRIAARVCREEERIRREQEREAQRRAAERTRYLDAVESREAESWDQLDVLIATKRPNDYSRAITILTDLRDLANRKSGSEIFHKRLRALCAQHAAKSSFLRRLKDAGLES
jgi:hypothetical protein